MKIHPICIKCGGKMYKPQNSLYNKTKYCTNCFSTSIKRISINKKYMEGRADI